MERENKALQCEGLLLCYFSYKNKIISARRAILAEIIYI